MLKQHGRWVYHRAFKSARLYSDGLEWWHGEEAAHTLLRLHLAIHTWNVRTAYASLAERVIRCTNRYARIFGGIRTVADWRKLALHIAERAGFTHYTTLRALQFASFRDRSLICIDKTRGNELRFPWPKWRADEVLARAEKINAVRQERKRRDQQRFLSSCAVCGNESTHPQWPIADVGRMDRTRLLELSGLLPMVERYMHTHQPIPFCFSHGMQFSRILRRTERLQMQRLQINRMKKELQSETA